MKNNFETNTTKKKKLDSSNTNTKPYMMSEITKEIKAINYLQKNIK